MAVDNGKVNGHLASVPTGFHIAALPYPGRGHINPMLSICELLAAKGILVTVVVTEEWVELLGARAATLPSNIRLRSIPNVLPSEAIRGANFVAFIAAVYSMMAGPVQELLEGLDQPVGGILADSSLPWAGELARRMGLPVGSLRTQSAMSWLALLSLGKVEGGHKIPQPYLDVVDDPLHYLPKTDPKFFDCQMSYLKRVIWCTTAQSLLFTSCYDIEAPICDALGHELKMPIYTLGPTIPFMSLTDNTTTTTTTTTTPYFKWLDGQPIGSVIYVSLGSFLNVSGPQMDEMAKGLHSSGVRFLWAVRGEPDKVVQLTGGRGMIVPWVDQLRVLCHEAIGGFLTHCGWNSTMEGAFAGVPMLTHPLIWDQFSNANLVVDYWKVGLKLKEDNDEGVVGWEKVARLVAELMEGTTEGEGRRQRAKILKENSRRALESGGSSAKYLDAFIENMMEYKKNVEVVSYQKTIIGSTNGEEVIKLHSNGN